MTERAVAVAANVPVASAPDLTVLTGNAAGAGGLTVNPALVKGIGDDVVTIVHLNAGHAVEAWSEVEWVFKGQAVSMAYRVMWQIDGVPDTRDVPDTGTCPYLQLEGVPKSDSSGQDIRWIEIYHTTPDGLPGGSGLEPIDVKEHFKIFYQRILKHDPDESELPQPPETGAKVNCGISQAQLGS